MNEKLKKYYLEKNYPLNNNKLIENKKMFSFFKQKVDSFLPVLILGAGNNKYPLQFLKSGFDVRVLEFNETKIKQYEEDLNEKDYYYQKGEFNDMDKIYNQNSFSGIWIENALIFNEQKNIKKMLIKMYDLLDEEGYIFIKLFETLTQIKVNNFEIEPLSEFKLHKILSQINNEILEKANENIYIDFHKKIVDIKHFELIKYFTQIDVKSYDQTLRIANIIIRKR